MGFLDALLSPRAAVDVSDFDLGEGWKSTTSDSGVVVTAESAMRLVSVYACVTLIADAIRALPVDVFRREQDRRTPVSSPPVWLAEPNQRQTWGQFVDYVLHSLLTNGNGFVWCGARDILGYPVDLEVIHPSDVEVNRIEGRKQILVNGKEFSEFNHRNVNGQVLHILGHTADGLVGLSPIDQARQAIGSGLAIEEYGNRFFGNGTHTSGAVEMPVGSKATPDQLKQVARQFERRHKGLKNAWRPIVLANGATYKPMTVPNDQAQFIESAKLSSAEIAKLYRIPPHLVGDVERSTSWGTGIEQQGIGFVTYTLMPWLVRLEEAFSQLLPANLSVKFNANGLLRGDTKARFEAYQIGIQNGFTTRNEVRELEDMAPLEGGDIALMPLNLTAADGNAQASTRELTEMIQKIYLGVGKVLTAEEARTILNREGADLVEGFEPFALPTQSREGVSNE